jgi:hypothetical protein
MKRQNQVRKHISASTPPAQTKSPAIPKMPGAANPAPGAAALSAGPTKTAAASGQQAGPVSLQFHGPGADKPVACIELTAEELSLMRTAWLNKSSAEERRFDVWVKSALMRQANRDMISRSPLFRLEEAVHVAIGLVAIMGDSNLKLRRELRDGTDRPGDPDCGIQNLVRSASDQLLDAFNASWDYATGNKEVAA